MSRPSLKSYLSLGLALAASACVTTHQAEHPGCTDPKLIEMSQDVSDQINLALLKMQMITSAPHTRPQFGNYVAKGNAMTIDFLNRSMLVNDGNGMVNGNATLCEEKNTGEVDCYIGQASNFKSNPVVLNNLLTVTLGRDTVSYTAPSDAGSLPKTQWITVQEADHVCGAQSRLGESSKWCADMFGAQPPADVKRASACMEQFNLARNRIRQQLAFFQDRLKK